MSFNAQEEDMLSRKNEMSLPVLIIIDRYSGKLFVLTFALSLEIMIRGGIYEISYKLLILFSREFV